MSGKADTYSYGIEFVIYSWRDLWYGCSKEMGRHRFLICSGRTDSCRPQAAGCTGLLWMQISDQKEYDNRYNNGYNKHMDTKRAETLQNIRHIRMISDHTTGEEDGIFSIRQTNVTMRYDRRRNCGLWDG